MKKVHLLCILSMAFLLMSCAKMTSVYIEEGRTEHVVERNYKLNELKATFVGESMVVHKNYYVRKDKKPVLIANNKFQAGRLGGDKGEKFKIIGQILSPIQDIPLNVFVIGNRGFLVDDEGIMHKSTYDLATGAVSYPILKIEPENTTFSFDYEETVVTTRGFINYEFIYTGISNNTLTFLYREYTPDNLIRAAFSQNINYPVGAENVRFKNLNIKLSSVANDKIEFSVIED